MKKLLIAFLAIAGVVCAQPTTPISNARMSGTGLVTGTLAASGGGTITASPSPTLDLLGSVQGDVAYRGATGWSVLTPGTAGYVFTTGGSGVDPYWSPGGGAGPGTGTVTTFTAGNLSPLFTTAVATPTSTPALTFALSTQSANRFFAGPTSGSAAAPTVRAIVTADLPALTGGDATTPAGSGVITLNTVNTTVGTYGNATTVPQIVVNGKGLITGVTNVTISGGGSGNVTNNATLTSGRVLLGGGTTVIGVAGSAFNGQVMIGNTSSGNQELATITAGTGITVTNGAGSITINATGSGSGNVTNNATLTSGNVTIGGGSTVISTTNMSWNATNNTLTVPELNVTGNQTIGNLITTTLNVTGNITSASVTNGLLWVGNATSGNFEKGNVAGTTGNIVVTNSAAGIGVNIGSNVVTKATNEKTFYLTIDSLANSMNYGLGFVSAAFTISEIRAVHVGGSLSSPSILLKVYQGTDRSSGTAVVTAGTTITSSTTGNSVTSGFDDNTVPSNSWIWITTGSKSGTTGNLEIVVRGTYD